MTESDSERSWSTAASAAYCIATAGRIGRSVLVGQSEPRRSLGNQPLLLTVGAR